MIAASLLLAVTAAFTPPQLVSGDPPGLPPPNVVAGGEVLVEATIDTYGAVTHPVLLRNTPPYGQMVLDAISRWRFTPARVPAENGVDQVMIDSYVLIAAVYRPPTVYNGPTVGTAPLDQSRASSETPYPLMMSMPAYPPQTLLGGVTLLEVSLDEAGISKGARIVRSSATFDSAARDAVNQWQFRGASLRSRAVPANVYVIVGFPQPLGPSSSSVTPPFVGPTTTPVGAPPPMIGGPPPSTGGPSKIP